MATTKKPRRQNNAPVNTSRLRINHCGLDKAFTMDKNLARVFSGNTTKPELCGGVGNRPLSPEEIAWANQRKKEARAREAMRDTIARIRREKAIALDFAKPLGQLLKELRG